jgi:hypothetical protein
LALWLNPYPDPSKRQFGIKSHRKHLVKNFFEMAVYTVSYLSVIKMKFAVKRKFFLESLLFSESGSTVIESGSGLGSSDFGTLKYFKQI